MEGPFSFEVNKYMITWKDNLKDVVKDLDKASLNYKKAKIEAYKELTSIAFQGQVDDYFQDGKVKGKEYLPASNGDIGRITRRKTVSVKPYFSSKVLLSRSGDTKDSLIDAGNAASSDTSYKNENVGFKITDKSVEVFATSDKFATLEKAKSGGGTKGARNTTLKTWKKVIRLWNKLVTKRLAL